MKVTELVAAIKSSRPPQSAAISDRDAAALVRAAFAEILKQIAASGAEPVSINRLGTFRKVQVPFVKDGKQLVAQRIHFRPAVPPKA